MQRIMPQQACATNSRVFYFDFIRLFACLSVVMIHVSAGFAVKEVGSISYWVGNFFDSISRAGVPLFVMLSGALMLDENYAFTREKWIKHIGKMVWFFVFWSVSYCFVYKIVRSVVRGEAIDWYSAGWSIIKGHYHLWFIPMIIGLYLLVPLLRLWVKRTNRRHVEYFLILSMIFTFVAPQTVKLLICIDPQFESLYVPLNNMHMKMPLGFSAYFILGWYLHNFELPNKKLFYALGILGVCITFVGTYVVFAFTDTNEFIFYENFSVNVLLYAISVFSLAKSVFGCKQYSGLMLHKIVGLISKYSLGIYAVHVAVIREVSRVMAQVHAFIAIPVIFVVCIVVSALASFVMSRIPFMRKFI